MNADGGYLSQAAGRRNPYAASPSKALRPDTELAERPDNRFFQRLDIGAHVALPFSQIEDRIADDLPRAVKRHIAAAIGVMKLDSGALQHLSRSQQISRIAVAPHGDDGRMFHNQQLIRNLSPLALPD